MLALRVFAETLVTGDVTLTYAPGLIFNLPGAPPFKVGILAFGTRKIAFAKSRR